MARFDLHCHSTSSDGLLAPAAVVQRAASRGVEVLALTDHDDVSGIAEARVAAHDGRIELVDGCEVSVTWEGHTIHIVALGIDPKDPALAQGLASIRVGRDARARRIGEALAQAGIPGAFEGARRFVTSESLISRTHFARFLVEAGYQRDLRGVFKHYLTPGKPGYVRHMWATLPESVAWIHGAGGLAVLAHPGRYRISPTALRRLLGEFRDAGGDGIEVLSASHTTAQAAEFATLARTFGLLASTGSDFHGPGESWLDLGDLPELPVGVVPVWTRW
jgi:predicted metal-dependent phosphoesterase TrpH